MSTLPLQLSATSGMPFYRRFTDWTSALDHALRLAPVPMEALDGWRTS